MRPLEQEQEIMGWIWKILGKRGNLLFGIGVVSSFVQSIAEYSIAIFLMLFLFALGFVDGSKLPTWLPLNLLASPLVMWGALFLIVTVKAAGEIVTFQSKIILTELVYARLRMVLGYQILRQEDSHSILPLSEINLYMTEYFPKATSFIFYFTQSISFCIQAVVVVAGMIFFAWAEALVGIAGLCIMGLLVLRFNRINNRVSRKIPEVQARLERLKVRISRNWLLIKIMRLQDKEYEKFMNSIFFYFRHSVIAYFYGNLGASLMPLLGVIVIALIVIMSVQFFKTPAVQLVAFLYLFVRFTQKVSNISNLIGGLFTYGVQFRNSVNLFSSLSKSDLKEALSPERGFSLFKSNVSFDIAAGSKRQEGRFSEHRVGKTVPSISIEQVTFSWQKMKEPVFQNLSVHIAAGSQFGIIGPNGSGKSTLLGVVLGILKPSAGKVSVGELSADEYVKRYYESIAYVGAEPYLIYGTIRENLIYGMNQGISEEEIWRALEVVRLDGFVRGLPDGLNYVIQESGEGLSSGQKQRLAISRAFIRKPCLLVLDEPSSNLDEATETDMIAAFNGLKGQCTVIIVSHKPEILKGAGALLDLGSIQRANALIGDAKGSV